MLNFLQVTNQLPSSTLNNPYSTETFNSYVFQQLKWSILYIILSGMARSWAACYLLHPTTTPTPTLFCVDIINVWSLTCFYDKISVVLLATPCLCWNYLSKIMLNENIQLSVFYQVFSKMHFISTRKLSAWNCHFEVSET